jgi:YVTN family beta-propeller protein
MLEVHAVPCTLILTLVMALASSNTLLSVQRAGAHSVIATIPIGKSPVKINPITGNVYVASAVNRDDGTVSVISSSNKVIAMIPIGGFPGEIAISCLIETSK